MLYICFVIATKQLYKPKTKMDRVIFLNEENQNIFIIPKSEIKDFVIPRKGEGIVWLSMYMFVDLVEYDYNEKTIKVFVNMQ